MALFQNIANYLNGYCLSAYPSPINSVTYQRRPVTISDVIMGYSSDQIIVDFSYDDPRRIMELRSQAENILYNALYNLVRNYGTMNVNGKCNFGDDIYKINGNYIFGSGDDLEDEEATFSFTFNPTLTAYRSGTDYTYFKINTEEADLTTSRSMADYASNAKKYMSPANYDKNLLTTYKDFVTNYRTINNVVNGTRDFKTTVKYEKVGNSGRGTFDVGSDNFEANIFYSGNKVSTSGTEKMNVSSSSLAAQQIAVNNNNSSKLRVRKLQVYNPIQFIDDFSDMIKTEDYYDGTLEGTSGKAVLQADAPFKVTAKFKGYNNSNGLSYSDTRKFVKKCYFIFAFKVKVRRPYI